MPKTYAEIAARVRVPLGLLLGIIYVVFAQPTGRRLAWGAALAFAGLLLRASGAGHLAKNQTLATGGPYQYIRHPLYLGSILAGAGYCIAGGKWWFVALLAVFLGAVYAPVIRREEARLREIFPQVYSDYARKVPFFIPRLSTRPALPSPPSRFSWSLYRKNREYQAFLAYVAIVFVLLLKLYLRCGTG